MTFLSVPDGCREIHSSLFDSRLWAAERCRSKRVATVGTISAGCPESLEQLKNGVDLLLFDLAVSHAGQFLVRHVVVHELA